MWASTSTRRGSRPTSAWVTERASTPPTLEQRLQQMANASATTSSNLAVNTEDAARRWRRGNALAGRRHGRDPALYADDATYRALAFRAPDHGLAGVRRYLETNFAVERETECWFAEPLVAGDRAAVEWWGTWVEQRLTLAGATFLRFDDAGRVIDHRDYWNQVERREPPYDGWS